MNAKQKSVLAGGLGTLAAFVWVPQFLSGHGDAPVVAVESPAEQSSLSASSSVPHATGSEEEAQPSTTPSATTAVAAAASASSTRLSSLEASLSALAQRGSAHELSALFAQLEPPDRLAKPDTEPGPEPLAGSFGTSAWLTRFASENPLTGLVHGPADSVALLGHRVVRPGDRLLGGRVTVVSIGAKGLELAAEGVTLRVELPAFQARGNVLAPSQPPALPAGNPSPANPTTAPIDAEKVEGGT